MPASKFAGGLITPERLVEMSQDKYWDDELAQGHYVFPLPLGSAGSGEQFVEHPAPIPAVERYMVGPFHCALSPQTHKGPYRWAIDFLVEDGASVIAAAAGVVIEVVDRFTVWGDGPAYVDKLNLITIRHNNNEMTQYCHIAAQSATVEVGDRVRAGQKIAIVGKVGLTDRDHLHFIVFRSDQFGPVGFKSLRVAKLHKPSWWRMLWNWP